MLSLIFDGNPTAGHYLVHNDHSITLAGIDRHWTRTSFVVSNPDGEVLCKVDRGGLIFISWVAVTADDRPLLTFRSKVTGGKISFADGRSARLKRPFLSKDWSVVDERGVVLASGSSQGRRWKVGGGGLMVSMDEKLLGLPEVVAIAETNRLDYARRRRNTGVITDAIGRLND